MRHSSRSLHDARGAALAAALTIAAAGAATSADWPQLRGDVLRTGVASETLLPPLTLAWRYTAGAQQFNNVAPVIVGDTAYFAARGTQGGNLYAVDTMTGERRWEFPGAAGLPKGVTFPVSPTVIGDRIYAASSDGTLYVLNAKSGKKAQPEYEVGSAIASAPVIADGVLYLSTADGRLLALKADTYEPVWKSTYSIGDPIVGAPIIVGNIVYLQTLGNVIHAVAQGTGRRLWTYRVPRGIVPGAMSYAEGSLLIPNGNQLLSLQPRSGSRAGSAAFRATCSARPSPRAASSTSA